MTKRNDDPNPEPAGGRAAERLKQFEESRKPSPSPAREQDPHKSDKDDSTKDKA